MKHMKRALSLVLAMVMLLGMMVIPTGAVSNFTDETEITYTEAVEVTSGIGLFAGAAGKFMPKGTVTRAQMATIIVKMLHGSEANADSFKGVNGGFTDTASFEGGWAEGYINWCASLGVVAGYGDGTFKPGKAVTTAEAATMIINALGIDAGEGQWPLTVMSKADELKFFKDLSPKPDTNQALTREELAVIAFRGLEYSPEEKIGYIYNGVTYNSYMDAYLASGKDASKVDPAKAGSLAADVFGLKSVTGYITENQATGLDYTELTAYINGAWDSYKFDIETNHTAIGHYVTVYYDEQYTNENKPGKTYTIFDEGTVVEVTEDIDSRADFRDYFSTTNVKLSTAEACVVDSAFTVKTGYPKANGFAANDVTFITGDTYDVPAGTYILDGNTVVAYIEPAKVYASVIEGIELYEGEEKVSLRVGSSVVDVPNDSGNDLIDELVGMKAGDYVTYTMVGPRYVLERVRVVTGKVTAMSTDENGNDVVTVDGVDYVAFNGTRAANLGLQTDVDTLNYTNTYDFYTTRDGEFIGYKPNAGTLNMDNVAYILGVIPTTEKDAYGDQVINFYARGIDMNGAETLIPVALVKDTNRDGDWDSGEKILGDEDIAKGGSVAEGFYTVKDHANRDARKEGIQQLTPFANKYNKETSPVFVTPYTLYKTTPLVFGGMGSFGTSNEYYAYNQTSSKYLVLDGSATQITELQATVKTGSCAIPMDNNIQAAEAVLSRKADGSYIVEAMVIRTGSAAAVLGGQTVYVSQDKNKPSGQNQAGYVYDVYKAADGQATKITLATGSTLTPGFYQVVLDAETQRHEFVPMPTEAGRPVGYILPTVADAQKLTEDSNAVAAGDGLLNAAVCYDISFGHLAGTRMTAGTIKNLEAGGVAVVDVRSKEQKDGSRIATITTIDRVSKLKQANEDLEIKLDIWVNSSSNKITAIYITEAVDSTADSRYGSLLVSGGATNSFFVLASTDSTKLTEGGTYTPDAAPVIDCAASGCTCDKGIFQFAGSDSAGTTIRLKHLSAADAQGKLGLHNVVIRADGNNWVLADAHGNSAGNSTVFACDESMLCYNTSSGAAEASMYLNVANAKVYDLRDGQFTPMTLAALKSAIETGLNDRSTKDKLVLNYYCKDGYKDNTPEVIFVVNDNGTVRRNHTTLQLVWRIEADEWAYYDASYGTADLVTQTHGGLSSRSFRVAEYTDLVLLHYNELDGMTTVANEGQGVYKAVANEYGRTTLTYVTPYELTAVASTAIILNKSGGYTATSLNEMLDADAYKIMGVKVTSGTQEYVYVESVVEDLKEVTLSDGVKITIADDFAADAGYVEATVVSGANAGRRYLVKFDAASHTVAGDYQVSVSGGTITLNKLQTEDIADLNSIEAGATINFDSSVYADYQYESWLRANIANSLLTVKAKKTTVGSDVSYTIQSAYYKVPKGVVLYMADKTLKNDAKFGPFYVMANNGSSLTVGEKYYFAIENTSDARFYTQSDDSKYMAMGVYCYAWKDGEILTSGSTGVRKQNVFAGNNMLKDGTEQFIALGAQGMWARKLGYHRVVTDVTQVVNNQCTMTADFRGCDKNVHNSIWNCGSAAGTNVNNKTSGLTLTRSTVIVDARDGSKLTLEQFVTKANGATADLVVDFLSTAQHGTEIAYLVINDMAPLS